MRAHFLAQRKLTAVVGGEMAKMKSHEPVLLLVENDYGDVFMFKRALSSVGFSGTLRVVTGVTDAVSYLTLTGEHTDPVYNPPPDLIVCDLKLCASTGTELLKWIGQHPELRRIPVVMLSGSSTPAERLRARELGARAFFLKKGDLAGMAMCVHALLAFLTNPEGHHLQAAESIQQAEEALR